MPGAIDRYITLALSASGTGMITMISTDFQDECRFDWSTIALEKTGGWPAYIQAICLELAARGYSLGGFEGVFGGNIPIGAGLSSSAALCCGMVTGLSALFDLRISREENARIAQAAEHRVGLLCGLMDQYAVLFGKAGHVFRLDCKTLNIQYLPLSLEGYALALLDSHVQHKLAAGSGYNDRRAACERVVHTLTNEYPGIASLRDVHPEQLDAFQDRLDPVDFRRAKYVLQENMRVQQSAMALMQGNMTALGQILSRAHQGLRDDYEVTVPETDLLASLALETPGILGARQVGGGFGGCVLVLLEESAGEAALQAITTQYSKQTKLPASVLMVRPGDGVALK